MATTPNFTGTARAGVAAVSTANTARDGTGTIVDILTGVAAGTKVEEIIVQATGDPAASIVTIFYHNGTSYFLLDEFDLSANPAAASATVTAYRARRTYDNLILAGSSHKLAAAITVALTAGVVNVYAFGGDLG